MSGRAWRCYSPIGKARTRNKAPKTSHRMRTRPARIRSQEALMLTGMGSLTDIALLLILSLSGQTLENCKAGVADLQLEPWYYRRVLVYFKRRLSLFQGIHDVAG